MLTNDTLKDRKILVTGGGSGLGLAMSKHFASLGAQVAICGRTKERLEKAVAEIGPNTVFEVVDVRDYSAVEKMFARFSSEIGGIDGLVNNAAGNFYSASEDLTPNGFQTIVDIVLGGTFNCTQHFGRQLIESKNSGAVVNIVTTYAEHGSAFVLPSACAKAGVLAMTRSLAYEWAEYGIRLNAIAPGPIPTEGAWARLMPKEFEEGYRKTLPLKRFGKPEELSDLAAFLLSDMSGYVNGDCVALDGGEQLKAGQFNFLADLMPREKLRGLFSSMKPPKSKGA